MRITKPIMVAVMVTASLASIGPASHVSAAPQRPNPCTRPPQTPPEPKPTTIDVVGQVYYCVLKNYYSGPVLDGRLLLLPAFAALTQELQRRGLDQPDATMPALTGRRDADWAAFRGVLEKVVAKLPADAAQAALKAAIDGMVASLNDNHANWRQPQTSRPKLLGFRTSGFQGPGNVDPVGRPPLFVDHIAPGGPAEKAGMKLGDEIVSVDGVPPYVNGAPIPNVIMGLRQGTEDTVTLKLRRPTTGATYTRELTRAEIPGSGPGVESRLLPGDVAYVSLPGFFSGAADKVLAAVEELRKGRNLRGLVLDLRSNGGGSPDEVRRLLGAWAHNKIFSYLCTVRDECTPVRTDDSVALLKLKLVTLTDRGCASACDAFSSAVKDLRLGTLVGTRTAGVVAGPASPWILDDGSLLILPERHDFAANKEIINTVGVPPDHFAPVSSMDLATGRDPGVAKALSILK
ncbi:S41 family peptidase [Actinomadura sp. 9N215]|uniref:S41 family peptidase n=1 Tax=Actinomadura sp. 9N215 TaxID=3375150 RepID=UPI0037A92F18